MSKKSKIMNVLQYIILTILSVVSIFPFLGDYCA